MNEISLPMQALAESMTLEQIDELRAIKIAESMRCESNTGRFDKNRIRVVDFKNRFGCTPKQ